MRIQQSNHPRSNAKKATISQVTDTNITHKHETNETVQTLKYSNEIGIQADRSLSNLEMSPGILKNALSSTNFLHHKLSQHDIRNHLAEV